MPATFNIFSFVFINEEDELLLHVLRYFLVLGRSTVKFKSLNLASSNSQFSHTNWVLDGGGIGGIGGELTFFAIFFSQSRWNWWIEWRIDIFCN
jgi:hypothetical protein